MLRAARGLWLKSLGTAVASQSSVVRAKSHLFSHASRHKLGHTQVGLVLSIVLVSAGVVVSVQLGDSFESVIGDSVAASVSSSPEMTGRAHAAGFSWLHRMGELGERFYAAVPTRLEPVEAPRRAHVSKYIQRDTVKQLQRTDVHEDLVVAEAVRGLTTQGATREQAELVVAALRDVRATLGAKYMKAGESNWQTADIGRHGRAYYELIAAATTASETRAKQLERLEGLRVDYPAEAAARLRAFIDIFGGGMGEESLAYFGPRRQTPYRASLYDAMARFDASTVDLSSARRAQSLGALRNGDLPAEAIALLEDGFAPLAERLGTRGERKLMRWVVPEVLSGSPERARAGITRVGLDVKMRRGESLGDHHRFLDAMQTRARVAALQFEPRVAPAEPTLWQRTKAWFRAD